MLATTEPLASVLGNDSEVDVEINIVFTDLKASVIVVQRIDDVDDFGHKADGFRDEAEPLYLPKDIRCLQ